MFCVNEINLFAIPVKVRAEMMTADAELTNLIIYATILFDEN